MCRNEKDRQVFLRSVYDDGWDILSHWVICPVTAGLCVLEAVMRSHGFTPADLLEALVLGRPEAIGITSKGRR